MGSTAAGFFRGWPGFRPQHTHLLRSDGDAGEWAVVFRLARSMVRVDKTNAFVAHKDSLQGQGSGNRD
jgi:hypothetical protein